MPRPSRSAALLDEARAAYERGDLVRALALSDEAAGGGDDNLDALTLAGVIRIEAGEAERGVGLLERALRRAPGDPFITLNLAVAYRRMRRDRDAIGPLRAALLKAPRDLGIIVNLVRAEIAAGQDREALTTVEQAEKLIPDHPVMTLMRIKALIACHRIAEAALLVVQAIAKYPGVSDFTAELAVIKLREGASAEALALARPIIAAEPDHGEAVLVAATAALQVGDHDLAKRIHRAAPKHDALFFHIDAIGLHAENRTCDWDALDARVARVLDGDENEPLASEPMTLTYLLDRPDLVLAAANRFADGAPARAKASARVRTPNERLRVAYLSSDFRVHPCGILAADLIVAHDRERFEVIGFSVGNDDGSALRRHYERTFDHFVDLRPRSLDDAIAAMNGFDVDVLVEMNGHTAGRATTLVALSTAPVKVTWLGYPGTFGGRVCDYVIADPFTVPDLALPQFAEKIVRLPDTYQPAAARGVSPQPTDRAAHGLPENAFVFASFNDVRKITRPMLDVWARILLATPGSILWLLVRNKIAERAIVERLAAAGVDRARIVVAGNIALPDHYVRQTLADLALDTFPYTGHTTTSDALYVGLPVLTRPGIGMASRVAASFVALHGFPELIAEDEEDYVRKAIAYARDPEGTRALARRIREAVPTSKLFDAKRFARHMEGAFETMVELRRNGQPPRHFDVTPVD